MYEGNGTFGTIGQQCGGVFKTGNYIYNKN